jgi:hygromycin-B 7''-O-kinase
MKLPRIEDFNRDFTSEIWLDAAKRLCQKHRISFGRLHRAEHGESIIFLVDTRFVLKIYVPGKNGFEREKNALEIARTNLKIPEIIACGEIEGYRYLITTQLAGGLMTREKWLTLDEKEQIAVLTQLAEGLRELHQSKGSKIEFDWNGFIAHQAETCFERQKACSVNEGVLAQIPPYLEENLYLLERRFEPFFLHGDVHFGNLRLLKSGEGWQISGLFDFADSLTGFHEYEFLAVCLLMIQGQGNLQREFFRAFGYRDDEIDEELRKRLMLLTMFYECSDLRRYAVRLRPEAVEYSLLELECAIYNFC